MSGPGGEDETSAAMLYVLMTVSEIQLIVRSANGRETHWPDQHKARGQGGKGQASQNIGIH